MILLSSKHLFRQLLVNILIVLSLTALAACASSVANDNEEDATNEIEHEEDGHETDEHEEDEHENESADRVPNEGASIRVLAPESGSFFEEGDEVVVEVEVSGFALGQDGNHWHIYVDGTSWGMVVGGRTTEALRGLEHGERIIEVYLTRGDHVELQVGDSITVTIE